MAPWLAFDAGSPLTSCAVAGEGSVLLAESSGESRTGPSLLAQIDRTLESCGLRPTDLEGVVALTGPGSFTGIRVTLATALGLRAALTVPILGLSHLAALAVAADDGEQSSICSLIDALRDEWFLQSFRRESDLPPVRWSPLGPPERLAAGEIDLPAGVRLALHAGARPPEQLAHLPRTTTEALAPAVALAAADGKLGANLSPDLDPLYLRGFTPR